MLTFNYHAFSLSKKKKDVKVSDMKHKHPIIMQKTSVAILRYTTNFYFTNIDFVLSVLRYPLKRKQCHEGFSVVLQRSQ